MADHDLATPLTQQVLELRARRGELGPPALNPPHRDLQAVHRPIRGLRRDVDDAVPVVLVGLVTEERRHGDQ